MIYFLGSLGQPTDVPLEETIDEKCYQFSVGKQDKLELSSPNYPGLYPNNTDCIRVITAPIGHTLKLDFRDKFSLEPSEECKFDYLEIRDGAHGYDPLIGRYCGESYPPAIPSTSRSLWLRFRSDENIEYSGFRAIWEEVPKPESGNGSSTVKETEIPDLPVCIHRLSFPDQGFLNRSDIDRQFVKHATMYKTKLECMWIIEVKKDWKIQLQFLKFNLAVPNECTSNFVDVFPGSTQPDHRLSNFCGSIAETVVSPSNILQVRFVAEKPDGFPSNFEAMYTAFRDKVKSAEPTDCEPDEFDCEDATCIPKNLKCNGKVNCRFRTDEDPGRCQAKEGVVAVMLNTDHMIIILIVFFLILTGMCCAFLYNCFTKLIRDHRIIQEQMRASREMGLDSPALWKTRADSPETRESECQTRESVFSELGSLRPASVESTKSAPDVIISH